MEKLGTINFNKNKIKNLMAVQKTHRQHQVTGHEQKNLIFNFSEELLTNSKTNLQCTLDMFLNSLSTYNLYKFTFSCAFYLTYLFTFSTDILKSFLTKNKTMKICCPN